MRELEIKKKRRGRENKSRKEKKSRDNHKESDDSLDRKYYKGT